MSSDLTLKVLVTGATGYLAAHVIQQLQQAGHHVRGTVRDIELEERLSYLYDLCPDAEIPLELVEADLTKPESWKHAVSGCKYVIHLASPFPLEKTEDEMEVIRPAVEGTLAVLNGCRDAGGVKRVIITSSVAAITAGDATGTFNEDDWFDEKHANFIYNKSKTLAERTAWNFIHDWDTDNKFELVVLNPGYMMGPVLHENASVSMDLVKKLLERDVPALPRINLPVVDVRDVARAHVLALTTKEAAGRRIIIVAKNLWLKNIAMTLEDEFKDFGYNVPVTESPFILAKVLSFFDKTVQSVLPIWDVTASFDTNKMFTVLNMKPRPVTATILDMAYSMIHEGFVKMTTKYKETKEAWENE